MVGEVLHPGSIGIVTVRGNQGVIGGMANGCATYAQNEEEFLDEVTKTLAGRAGVSLIYGCLLYTSPSPRDGLLSRMPSSA